MSVGAESGRPSGAGLTRDLGLVLWQIRYEQRAFWRNRGRGVFTFAFPLILLVVFASVSESNTTAAAGGKIAYDDFFVPGILAYGAITTTYVNLAISTAVLRDQGVLKRMQGTPLPRWVYIAARIGSSALLVLIMTLIVLVLGRVAYSVPVRISRLPAMIVTLMLGTAAFTTLGIGITRFIRNAESAPVIVNLTIWPLSFISGIWFPIQGMSKTLKSIANAFPIRPLADGLQTAVNPHTTGAGFVGHDLRTLVIWTAVGSYLMLRSLNRPEGDRG